MNTSEIHIFSFRIYGINIHIVITVLVFLHFN